MPHSEIPVRLTSLKNSFEAGINRRLQNNQTLDNSDTCGGRRAPLGGYGGKMKIISLHRHGKFNHVRRERELRHYTM